MTEIILNNVWQIPSPFIFGLQYVVRNSFGGGSRESNNPWGFLTSMFEHNSVRVHHVTPLNFNINNPPQTKSGLKITLKNTQYLKYSKGLYTPSGSGTVNGTENDDVAPDVDVAVMTRLWLPGLNLVKLMAKFREPEDRE